MPKIPEIYTFLKQLAPLELAEEWDNPGLLIDCGGDVTSVLCALDITADVVREAETLGCQLIVSHHPVIFTPLKSLRRGDVPFLMVKKNISGICMHTNLDAAEGGVNDLLARLFGLTEIEKFEGLGRIGKLKEPVSAAELAEKCRAAFKAPVKYVEAKRPVRTLAIVGGAGDMAAEAAAAGADCLLTGEGKHHAAIDAAQLGIGLIAAGHFATEFPIIPYLADRLAKAFSGLRVVISRKGTDPYTYL
ncbi:MAG: Nif3-like dinuclear metal center hexameric protein [Oscillospiraceae bacterium]|nr:Nif3-like dinuclear metal center hexameric protein [Oscillospiraceae bacterium]